MAKKNRYAGLSQHEINAIKEEKRASMLAAMFFLVMIIAGIALATLSDCGGAADDEAAQVSPSTVIAAEEQE